MNSINERIKSLVDERFRGNIRQFALAMGITNSTKINRLFMKNKNNGEYPLPSTEIILLISNTFNVSTDWLLKGETPSTKRVNNINIDNKKIDGDGNVTNSTNVSIDDKNEYMEIIKRQQEQINKLLEFITKTNG